MTIQALPYVDEFTSHKIKLTIPIVANLMSKGLRQADIARMCGITKQTVSQLDSRSIFFP